HIRSRGEEKQAIEREPGFRARRWVVERTYSWLDRFRGLLIRLAKKPRNRRGLLQLACGLITGGPPVLSRRPISPGARRAHPPRVSPGSPGASLSRRCHRRR